MKPLVILFAFLCVFSSHAHAGAVVAQKEQMQAMMQQQAQAQYQAAVQQAVAERQAAEMQAYQQAVAEYQAAQIQAAQQYIVEQAAQAVIAAQIAQYVRQTQIQVAQQAMLKRAVEEELAKQIAVRIQQKIAVNVQDQMVAQAVAIAAQRLQMQAYQNALVEQAMVQKAVMQERAAFQEQALLHQGLAQKQAAQAAAAGRPYEPVAPEEIKDVVDIAQVWQKLEANSKAWALLIDNEAKAVTVNEFIERFRKEGTRIQKPPLFYANMIDDMASQNPQMLLKPFKEVLQILAIMEYDFGNGTDPDQLAKRLLGPAYEHNKQRLGK